MKFIIKNNLAEKGIDMAINLLDSGKPRNQILEEIKKESLETQAAAKSTFLLYDGLFKAKKEIPIPSEDFLREIISKAAEESLIVTEAVKHRYLYSEKHKGRFNFITEVSNLMLKKIFVPGVVIVLIAAGFLVLRRNSGLKDVAVPNGGESGIVPALDEGSFQVPSGEKERTGDETTITVPAGSAVTPTAIADAILGRSEKEQSDISAYDDNAILESDSSEIADLNTIYNEKDF